MNIKHFPSIFTLGLLLAIPSTSLGQGKVMITSPAEGATLDALDENRLVYEVDPGPRGDHVHVYIDDKEVGILRKLKGTHAARQLRGLVKCGLVVALVQVESSLQAIAIHVEQGLSRTPLLFKGSRLLGGRHGHQVRFSGRIELADVRSPIDGVIIAGDLRRSLGQPLTRGQVLFEHAPDEARELRHRQRSARGGFAGRRRPERIKQW